MQPYRLMCALAVHAPFDRVVVLPGFAAGEGERGGVREHGKIANTPAALTKLVSRLACGGRALRFCYEAGPCGYGIQRQLSVAN